MGNKFFSKKSLTTSGKPVNTEENLAIAERAAELLATPTALMQLKPEDARVVVRYMQSHCIEAGDTFIKEGDTRDTSFMVLILEGEAAVETIAVSRTEPVMVSVLGPGSLMGEMALLDGEPRSALLRRQILHALHHSEPPGAGRTHGRPLARCSQADPRRGPAERLRSNADTLKMFVQLTQVMQQEISTLATN